MAPPPVRRSTAGTIPALLCTLVLLMAACTAATDSEPAAGPGSPANSTEGEHAPEVLDLELDDEVVAELYQRDPRSNDRVEARVIRGSTGEELALDGGIRFRGSGSRLHPKKSFNIRFEEGQNFLFGSNRLNLKAMYSDPTLMREALTMAMWHELGHPAPRTAFVDLYINGIYEGLYVHVERVDGDLLEDHGLDRSGTLVRDRFRNQGGLPGSAFGLTPDEVNDLGTLIEDGFDSRHDPDWGVVTDLVEWAIGSEAGPDFAEELGQRFDVDILVDWLALLTLSGDVDSFGDDYWLYLDHDDPDARWMVIPWDNDLALGHHARHGVGALNDYFSYDQDLRPAAAAWQNGLVERILDTETLARRIDDRVVELMADPFDRAWFEERIGAILADIGPSLTASPGPGRFALHPQNHHGELGRLDQHVEALVDYVDLRWARLARLTGADEARPPARPDKATVWLDGDAAGERLLLADADGYVLAALTVTAVDGAGELAVRVEPFSGPPGVDHAWHVTATGLTLEATVELFYRNDTGDPNTGITDDNWLATDDPVGDQHDLALVAVGDDDELALLTSRVNPYANKVVADLTIDQGSLVLALVLPDDVVVPDSSLGADDPEDDPPGDADD